MSFVPISKAWPADRALILVHGIGDAGEASYERLLAALETALGADWPSFAVYPLLYDLFNDWTAAKLNAAARLTDLVTQLAPRFDGGDIGTIAAEYAGDVIWPVLAIDARQALRDAILAQLARTFLDGNAAGLSRRERRVSVVAHSLGCFHVYEALSAAALEPNHRLTPGTDAAQLESVVMMASPVELIRTVAKRLGGTVPDRRSLFCTRGDALELPGEVNMADQFIPSTRKLVSLTGTLDPVGGHLFREKLDWAYMDLPGQLSVIDPQSLFNINTLDELRAALKAAIENAEGPALAVNNPHDWVGYVERNETSVREWLLG